MARKTKMPAGLAAKTSNSWAIATSFQCLLAAIIAISIIETLLAASGIITPILSYAPANLFFAFLRLAIVVYAGLEYAHSGVARAAIRGGALFLASSLALCAAVLAAPFFATHPILGIFVMNGEMPALLAIIVLENATVGAAICAAAAWLSRQEAFRNLLSGKKS